jgi:threonine dehydratase
VRVVRAASPEPLPAPIARAPTAEDLLMARAMNAQPWARDLIRTEVRRAAAVDAFVALESSQITGSFKVRGALFALARMHARGVREVVVVSAGNHGAGVSFAARALGMKATVCVPETAPAAKRDKIRGWGAEIIVVPTKSYDEAEVHAKKLAADRGLPFLSPYDDHDVVLGNGASLAYDVVRALGRVPDLVLAPFGGGGLATGLAWGFAEAAGEDLASARRVWGVQTEASPAMAASLERGAAVVAWDSDDTVAEGLEGGISEAAFDRARRAVAGVLVVSEAEIREAMRFAHEELGLVVEGSAAAAIAPMLAGLPLELGSARDVVLVLTGSNVDPERHAAIVSRSA